MEALVAFLRRSPAHLTADAPLLVLGNEAADLPRATARGARS